MAAGEISAFADWIATDRGDHASARASYETAERRREGSQRPWDSFLRPGY
jgi:hypothetical protein